MSIFEKLKQVGFENSDEYSDQVEVDLLDEVEVLELTDTMNEAEEDADVAEIVVAQAETGVEQLTYLYEAIKGQALTAREAMLVGIGIESIIKSNGMGDTLAADIGTVFGSENYSGELGTESIAEKIKKGAKATFDAIITFLKKVYEFVLSLFGSLKTLKSKHQDLKSKIDEIKSQKKVPGADSKVTYSGFLSWEGKYDTESIISGAEKSAKGINDYLDALQKLWPKFISLTNKNIRTGFYKPSEAEALLKDTVKPTVLSGGWEVKLPGSSFTNSPEPLLRKPVKPVKASEKSEPFSLTQLESAEKVIGDLIKNIENKKSLLKPFKDSINLLEGVEDPSVLDKATYFFLGKFLKACFATGTNYGLAYSRKLTENLLAASLSSAKAYKS